MNNYKKYSFFILYTFFLISFPSCRTKGVSFHQKLYYKKAREVRATWWPTVWRSDYLDKNKKELESLFIDRIETLKKIGINTIIFQVRSEGDAFYHSELEPWSRFISGTQGLAPPDNFDPLEFIIKEAHARGIELHAWVNPFRVALSLNKQFSTTHLIYTHPKWLVKYNKQIYLDPGLPQVRNYVCKVISDIVSRYDIDAIHIDDYFYPYPINDIPFNDNNSFYSYGLPNGYTYETKGDWRRDNISAFIVSLREVINKINPSLPIGISPFGIYRNKKNFKYGSKTYGLEGYNALYADVLLWAKKGWIDYIVPQLYWNIGYSAADYKILTKWWGKQNLGKALLFIGQDIKKTKQSKQFKVKTTLQRKFSGGDFWWPADIFWNKNEVFSDTLSELYYDSPILSPINKIKRKIKNPIQEISIKRINNKSYLSWNNHNTPKIKFYLVYGLLSRKKRDFPKKAIRLSLSNKSYLKLSKNSIFKGFAITSIDKNNNESPPKFFFF